MAQIVNLFPKPEDDIDPFSSLDPEPGDESTEIVALNAAPIEDVDIQKGCRLVVHTEPRGPAAERFRYLRIRLRDPWESGKLKTVLVTSALPQDGKSTIALNLASSLCEHGKKKVLLIEGDLHRPSLALQLGLEPGPGLVECLGTDTDPIPLIRRLEPLGWYLLKAGGKCINPTELLQSGMLPALLAKLTPHFDWILLDSPPVIPVTDALAMAREVDAVLMVVRAGSTPREAVQRSLAQLGRRKLLAVVLNAIEGLNLVYSKYGYYNNPELDGGPTAAISGAPAAAADRVSTRTTNGVRGTAFDGVLDTATDHALETETDDAPGTSSNNGQNPDMVRAEFNRRRKRFGNLRPGQKAD